MGARTQAPTAPPARPDPDDSPALSHDPAAWARALEIARETGVAILWPADNQGPPIAVSRTDPAVYYRLKPAHCPCQGFARRGWCAHLAALRVELGTLRCACAQFAWTGWCPHFDEAAEPRRPKRPRRPVAWIGRPAPRPTPLADRLRTVYGGEGGQPA